MNKIYNPITKSYYVVKKLRQTKTGKKIGRIVDIIRKKDL